MLERALPRTGMSEILCCDALGWHEGSRLAVGVNRSFEWFFEYKDLAVTGTRMLVPRNRVARLLINVAGK